MASGGRGEVVHLYRAAVRALAAAEAALNALAEAVGRRPGRLGPIKVLAYASVIEVRDAIHAAAAALRRHGPLYGDRDRTPKN
jgi:hypothetical protein